MPTINLTDDELDLLREALDSHKYWELSDKGYRSSGYVLEPGSEDPEAVASIAACDALVAKLAQGDSRQEGGQPG